MAAGQAVGMPQADGMKGAEALARVSVSDDREESTDSGELTPSCVASLRGRVSFKAGGCVPADAC